MKALQKRRGGARHGADFARCAKCGGRFRARADGLVRKHDHCLGSGQPPENRGGARTGAGRKPTGKRKRLTVSLPADLSERVRAVATAPNEFVQIAVERHLERVEAE